MHGSSTHRSEGWGARALSCVASGDFGALSWLDGGPGGRSVFGLTPAEEVRSDDLRMLDELGLETHLCGTPRPEMAPEMAPAPKRLPVLAS